MGPPSYMRSVVDRNIVMRPMAVFLPLELEFHPEKNSVVYQTTAFSYNKEITAKAHYFLI